MELLVIKEHKSSGQAQASFFPSIFVFVFQCCRRGEVTKTSGSARIKSLHVCAVANEWRQHVVSFYHALELEALVG